MEWRRALAGVFLLLVSFFAGFITRSPVTNSDAWYTSFKRPDRMLVVVGIITFIIIGWQSSETRRSAKVTAASAKSFINKDVLGSRLPSFLCASNLATDAGIVRLAKIGRLSVLKKCSRAYICCIS